MQHFKSTLGTYKVGERAFQPVLLAPLSGITDHPFRKVVRLASSEPELPCLTFSEMVASKAVIGNMKDSRKLDLGDGDHDGMVVQLAGTDAETCAEAAVIVEQRGAIGIDLNFGCPARKVVKKAAGSSLMRDEKLCGEIFRAVVDSVSVPVSVKMRLGWDHTSLNAATIAKMAEDAGAHALTVHGRTRCQFYNGEADWELIYAVKEAVSIPLVVNGDIGTLSETECALVQSGADFAMIGRKAVGQPWALGEISQVLQGKKVTGRTYDQKVELMYLHLKLAVERDGELTGIRNMRKHFLGYAKSLIKDEIKRENFFRKMLQIIKEDQMFAHLDDYFGEHRTTNDFGFSVDLAA
ncbi:MAG: tRNA dihydrouridine synthase DusB [Alphaproteobacteria bacterium]